MTSVRSCPVEQAQQWLQDGRVRLIDVRELPEYAQAHVEGASLVPLGELKRRPELIGGGGEVLVICRSGRRATEAAEILERAGNVTPLVVQGGMDAWLRAGLPVKSARGPISLERQVRIAAGTLVLTGLLIPGQIWLSYFVGAGLVFAGITDTCAMGLLLAKLPWNRRPVIPVAGSGSRGVGG